MDTSQAITRAPQFLIRLYQLASFSPARTCRFYPTCSQYAIDALNAKGFWKGSAMMILRILKCHPLHPGGYDPVS